jgi:hypothetical protein
VNRSCAPGWQGRNCSRSTYLNLYSRCVAEHPSPGIAAPSGKG